MLHRPGVSDSHGRSIPGSTLSASQISYNSQKRTPKAVMPSQRYSLASTTSSTRQSTSSYDSLMKTTLNHPSAIPRSTSATSQARLSVLAASRPVPARSLRIISPAHIPTFETANVRGQPRSTDKGPPPLERSMNLGTRSRRGRMITLGDADAEHNSVLGAALPPHLQLPSTNLPPRLIPELQALASSPYRSQFVTNSTDTVSSPSTIYTGSPSPWSASTTATTPISWSSASPSILQTSYSPVSNKRSQTVPIPTVTRLKALKLPAVQERASVASLSAKVATQNGPMSAPPSRKIKKTPLSSPAPTPPPRSSSVKKTRPRSNSRTEEQHSIRDEPRPPLPTASRAGETCLQQGHRDPFLDKVYSQSPAVNTQHVGLLEALRSGPDEPRVKHSPKENLHNHATNHQRPAEPPQRNVPSASSTEPSTPTSARSRLAKFSKLAMFGRTEKNVADDSTKTAPQKTLRKGPQAGTGHEGYRKYSKRARSYSTDGSNAGTDSESSFVSTTRNFMRSASRKDSSASSRHSRKSQSELDDFAASRMKPVAILGGSRRSVSEVRDSYSHILNLASDVEMDLEGPPPVAVSESPTAVRTTRPSTFAAENGSPENTTRAQRRSRKLAMPETFPQLDRIATENVSAQPFVKNWNVSQSSVALSTVAMTDVGSDAYDTDVAEKQRKRSRRSKWNIFRRRDNGESKVQVQQRPLDADAEAQLQVSISAAPAEKSLPYYALLDSEGEPNTAETLERYLDESTRTTNIEIAGNGDDFVINDVSDGYDERHRSIMLPSPPLFNRDIGPSKMASLQMDNYDKAPIDLTVPADQDARQPRLAQVGRIPKVVTGQSIRRPSRTSFSRPFQLNSVADSQRILPGTIYCDPAPARLDSDTRTVPAFDRPDSNTDSALLTNSSVHPNVVYARDAARHLVQDAFKLADRQSTTSSSSDGMISIMEPPLLPSFDSTPKPHQQTSTEEDVWKEYDDLIDHVTSPTSPEGSPNKIQCVEPLPRVSRHRLADRFEMPSATLYSLQKELDVDASFETIPMIYAAPEVFLEPHYDQETRLRRSRIVSALNSPTAPSSPFSIGDYAMDSTTNLPDSNGRPIRISSSTSSSTDGPSPRDSTSPEELAVQITPPRHENSLHIDEVRRSRNPAKHSEMSYASLMVSRWLSFGRVLFSPGHLEVQRQTERHVLVIDGLGNDDWSIYCAVTYQGEQAYVHDLKETGHQRAAPTRTTPGAIPHNLRRREVVSLYDPLKYPDNFFSVIVLRFPPAMAESKLRKMISECRRVLMPGGYMELMLLDLDIVNMGVLTRRALRSLKTKMATADPGVSLKPVLDSFQSVLGDAGFAKLSQCMVGVPVVGKPPEAIDSPVSSRSSGGSDINRFNPSAGSRPSDGLRGGHNFNFSLNDLVADHSDNADAKISKMVSRTACSWWQHCFEASVINDGDLAHSIFADKQVLRECKVRASSFKLLIAYTQKPTKPTLELKRRTMSEPAVATLASA